MLSLRLLMAQHLVEPEDLDRVLEYQREHGGRVTDIMVNWGLVTPERMEHALSRMPEAPRHLDETGIAVNQMLRLMLKSMMVDGRDTPSDLADRLKVPTNLVNALLQDATFKKLIEAQGSASASQVTEIRYGLSSLGRTWAAEALDQNQYVGAMPVSLDAYCAQIKKQRMAGERVDKRRLEEAYDGLVIPEFLYKKLGPAINSANSILLYGPPGNGKTSIAERMNVIFDDIIFVPYCIEVEGQIIKIFDPSIHHMAIPDGEVIGKGTGLSIRQDVLDPRWVPCKRPVIITGGELTLEMLDLQFNETAKFYEAPLHLKAINGTFIIDDFGRQQVTPTALLNRWIVPLASRVDYMKLHTGKSFQIPFDEMVVFSTNLEPDDLMDAAFLRRIPYKLEINYPSKQDYRIIFDGVARSRGLELTDPVFEFIVRELQVKNGQPLAAYQPRFIVDQVLNICKFEGIAPVMTEEFVREALTNLYTQTEAVGKTAAGV
ncbi:hypothetical protein [Zavarzinia sp. CC-PAN008]|uniref:hypothetical protein n=1 Tax=Zavarzinia sp. CC-PAN008 TaxID=3243332 RepID=UPI003F74A476